MLSTRLKRTSSALPLLGIGLVALVLQALPASATTTTTTTTTSTTIPGSTTTTTVPSPYPYMQLGAKNASVLAFQLKLASSGYWIGNANGTFTDLTQQAVYALEKVNGLPRDGVVTRRVGLALNAGLLPRPVTSRGLAIEVSLTKQILLIVRDGKIVKIINASTGGGYSYATGTGGTSIAITPPGVYSTYYEVNKWDVGPLGGLYRPKYFNRGIAVHGSYSVPPYPASHGCVRVSLAAMDWIWLNNMMPRGTKVVVYK